MNTIPVSDAQNSEIEDVSLISTMPAETPKKKNYLPWIFGILVLVTIAIVFIFYIFTRENRKLQPILEPTLSATPSYDQTLEEVKYSNLLKKFGFLPTENELSLLQSKEFPFSLKYPKGYYLNYIGPSKDYPNTTIFVSPDLKDKEGIDSIVQCEKENRISPSGICRESIPGFLDISVGKETNITDQDPEASPSSQYSTSEFAFADVFVVTSINPHGNLDGTATYKYHLEYRRQIKTFSQITMDIETASNPATHPDILKAIIAVTQSFTLPGSTFSPNQ